MGDRGVTSAVVVALVGLALDLLPFVAGYPWCSPASRSRVASPVLEPLPGRGAYHRRAEGRVALGAHPRDAARRPRQPRSSSTAPGSSCTSASADAALIRCTSCVSSRPRRVVGIVATVQSLALLVGYLYWRRRHGSAAVVHAARDAARVVAVPAAISLTGNLVVVAGTGGGGVAVGRAWTLFDELMDRIHSTA